MSTVVINASSSGWLGGALDYEDTTIGELIPFPSGVRLNHVTLSPLASQACGQNPFDLSLQVQDWGGRAWRLFARLEPLVGAAAAEWTAFLESLAGAANRFSFNVDPYATGWSPSPGILPFRMLRGSEGVRGQFGKVYGASIEAIQAIAVGNESAIITAGSPFWSGGALGYVEVRDDVVDANEDGWTGTSNDFEGYPP